MSCKSLDETTGKVENHTSKFAHSFSGWSVWIEPSPEAPETKSIEHEMESIALKCGGEFSGVHRFPPHCTLLYNFNPEKLVPLHLNNAESADEKATTLHEHAHAVMGKIPISKEDIAKELLQKCKTLHSQKYASLKSTRTCNHNNNVNLNPTEFYFFPYPKEADNGKGFGCVIPLLLVENTAELSHLQRTVCQVFPPDERHCKDQMNRQDIANEGKFIPHMALCYAPENRRDFLQTYVNELQDQRKDLLQTVEAPFLSVWNTEGLLSDWKLVERIKLQ